MLTTLIDQYLDYGCILQSHLKYLPKATPSNKPLYVTGRTANPTYPVLEAYDNPLDSIYAGLNTRRTIGISINKLTIFRIYESSLYLSRNSLYLLETESCLFTPVLTFDPESFLKDQNNIPYKNASNYAQKLKELADKSLAV
jgi:hypothetical protein